MSLFKRTAAEKPADSTEEAPARKPRARTAKAAASADLLTQAAESATANESAPQEAAPQAGTPTAEAPPVVDVAPATAAQPAGAASLTSVESVAPAAEATAGAQATDAATPKREKKSAKPKRSVAEQKEHERQMHREVAKGQRARNKELIREFLPNQRGAVMLLDTRLGSITVEGWFKRTYVRATRLLYRIHTFPLKNIGPEYIQEIERNILKTIMKTEAALSADIAKFDAMLLAVTPQLATYQRFYEEKIPVSTKAAMTLHAVYQKADEVHRRIETADLVGVLDDKTRRKAIGNTHRAIFGLITSIERYHTGLYIRVMQSAPEVAEVDASEAIATGKPVDRVEEAPSAEVREPQLAAAD